MTNELPTIHVGIDASKGKLAVAIAGGGVRDEALSWGTFENTPASVDRLLKKLSGRGPLQFSQISARVELLVVGADHLFKFLDACQRLIDIF